MNCPRLSPTSLRRFPRYRAIAKTLLDQGCDYITSADLARACDMKEILVRKDLAQTGVAGRRSCGYPIRELVTGLTNTIGWDRPHRVVVIGAGHLAEAIVEMPSFAKCNISFVFAADVSLDRIGETIGGVPVISEEEAFRRLAEDPVQMAIVTVPTEVAQSVTDRLVEFGVRAILNFTGIRLTVPEGVTVAESDVLPPLAILCNALKEPRDAGSDG